MTTEEPINETVWEVEKVSRWMGEWRKYPSCSANTFMEIKFDQLYIISNDKILETLHLTSKMKGFIKYNVFILIIGDIDKYPLLRKIKFRFVCNEKQIAECLSVMRNFFNVIETGSSIYPAVKAKTIPGFISIKDQIKAMMENCKNNNKKEMMSSLPTPFTEFVKLCILDPMFPEVVNATDDAIKQLIG